MSGPTAAAPTARESTAAEPALEAAHAEFFQVLAWEALTPGERLARAWALRARLPDPWAAHEQKLFPAP